MRTPAHVRSLATALATATVGALGFTTAVPVAPAQWRPDAAEVDDFVCPHPMRDFWAVGQFYEDFTQTTDEEVARLLRPA